MTSNDFFRSTITLFFLSILFVTLSCQNNKQQIIPLSAQGPDTLQVNTGNSDDLAKLEQHYLKNLLDTLPRKDWIGSSGYSNEIREEVKNFYKLRDYRTVWTTYAEGGDTQEDLLALLSKADEEGLMPSDYQVEKAKKWAKNLYEGENKNFTDILRHDIFLSTLALRYLSDLHYGKIRPEKIREDWEVIREKMTLATQMNKALREGDLDELVEANRPPFFAYEKMKEALAEYEEIKEKGGWPRITGVDLLEEGDSNQAVIRLKKRLTITGDYPGVEDDSLEAVAFTEELTEKVKEFQVRHGLEVDGLVGGSTLERLNEPVDVLISRIRLNLERLRWQPIFSNKKDFIIVNLPEYKLRYYSDNSKELEMNVVIGDREHTTPVIIDSLEYVTFSPTWAVPPSIAGKEFLPILRKNPGYLASRNFKLYASWDDKAEELDPYDIDWDDVEADNFPYFIEQQPGGGNSLGKVKFMMPNKRAIYLHDTPADHLFSQPQRSFSHGCIRLEKPAELAMKLLSKQDPSWDMRKINEYMNMPEPENVVLESKIPVYFLYLTAFVDESGTLNFREDVYGMDDIQQRYLSQR
ncbi:murein L,D-transpeptidase [Roseivirga sp. BDSF3-8]|uniref:L,D-transpeptidase family protein n=1 Tax=Roseivirga sp. BDSF3-8 TaxID=3241598 RepID=UPI003531D071